jgi:hypothetical protein
MSIRSKFLEHLERVPFMGYAEARNGPLVLYNDIFYANLGLTSDGVRSRSVTPGIGGTLSGALGVDLEERPSIFWPGRATGTRI